MYKLAVAAKPLSAFVSAKIVSHPRIAKPCRNFHNITLGHPKNYERNNTKPLLTSNHGRISRTCRCFSWQQWPAIVSSSKPVLFAQDTLVSLHDTLGLTWFSTLIIAVLGIRTAVTLPLAVYQNYIMAKYENIHLEIAELAQELTKEMHMAVRMYKWDEKTAQRVYRQSLSKCINELIVRDNCHPAKSSILILFQLPIWFSLTFALRNMSIMQPLTTGILFVVRLEMSVGGALWFTNLTVPDPTFVIPVLMGLVNLTIIELHALRKVGKQRTRLQTVLTNVMRGVSVIMVPIAATLPSCISLYWLLSSTFGLGQNMLLMLPRFRRFCRIPVAPSESETPIKDILEGAKKKLGIS